MCPYSVLTLAKLRREGGGSELYMAAHVIRAAASACVISTHLLHDEANQPIYLAICLTDH